MMERTRIHKALGGVRGRASIDMAALEQLMVRFSELVVEQPAIAELDINPLLASPERLLALEEHDGYMDLTSAWTAHLGRSAAALRAEHEVFRGEARRLVQQLERLPVTELEALDTVCEALLGLLSRVEEHNSKEIALLQEAFSREEGGEG